MSTLPLDGGPSICLAFRFHVNFYHSYRGDSLDERGIGKDIRIIRGILDDLDRLEAQGVPVRGAWDIENYFSMEKMMPASAPELLDRIVARVKSGRDEAEAMSYNNGIVSACTDEEFDEQLRLLKSNEGGSGLDDVFGAWAPILRPQECMFTPSFLSRYPAGGIGCVSLYYSAVPFNGFSTLIRPLPFEQRYNPSTLRSRTLPGQMTLLPCYNDGDVADRFMSIRSWIRSMRREQLRMDKPRDLLLLVDHDADDQFWAGYRIPVLSRLLPSFDGLYRMASSVADLPYLRFETPGDYLERHESVGELFLDQDTADGSFDGYSSWAEKWENTELWTKVQAARNAASCAAYLAGADKASIERPLRESLRQRLLAISTTHFGMASPVMNVKRLADGHERADAALKAAREALASAFGAATADRAPESGDSDAARAGTGGSIGGARVARRDATLVFPTDFEADAFGVARLSGVDAAELPRGSALSWTFLGERHAFARCSLPAGRRTFCLAESGDVGVGLGVGVGVDRAKDATGAGSASVAEGLRGGSPQSASSYRVEAPWVSYGTGVAKGRADGVDAPAAGLEGGGIAEIRRGSLDLGASRGRWTRAELRLPGSSGRIFDVEVRWPSTPDQGWKRGKSERLARRWDARWKEVAPLEIVPAFELEGDRCFIVWKRNFFGETSSYRLDYHEFSRNRRIASFNNHLTNAWVAVGDGERGIVVAQHEGLPNNFAFCPMRQEWSRGRRRLRLNPFGTYYGSQWKYPTAVTGVGRALALRMADQLDSYAPSYNGNISRFSVAVYEFEGAEPPSALLAEAALYASAPTLVDAREPRRQT